MFNKALETNELFSLVHILLLNTDDPFWNGKIPSPDISKSGNVEKIFITLATSRKRDSTVRHMYKDTDGSKQKPGSYENDNPGSYTPTAFTTLFEISNLSTKLIFNAN